MAKRKVFNVLLLAITSQLVKQFEKQLFNTGLWEQLHGKISKVCRSEDVDATSTQSNDATDNKTVSSSMHCI